MAIYLVLKRWRFFIDDTLVVSHW